MPFHSFQVNSSMVFNAFSQLCNYHHNLILEHLHHLENKSCAPSSHYYVVIKQPLIFLFLHTRSNQKTFHKETPRPKCLYLLKHIKHLNFSFIHFSKKKHETLSSLLSKVRITLIPKSDKTLQEKKTLHADSIA